MYEYTYNDDLKRIYIYIIYVHIKRPLFLAKTLNTMYYIPMEWFTAPCYQNEPVHKL